MFVRGRTDVVNTAEYLIVTHPAVSMLTTLFPSNVMMVPRILITWHGLAHIVTAQRKPISLLIQIRVGAIREELVDPDGAQRLIAPGVVLAR